MSQTLLLSRNDLAALLDPPSVIEAVEEGFKSYSAGRTVTPVRIHLEVPGSHDLMLVMPCATREPDALGTKVASVFRGNPGRGLPTVTSIYLLSEFDTGQPLAAMDGTLLTAVRTAAASAVATRALSRSVSATLGIFGTGTLAESHLRVLPCVRTFRQALIRGRTLDAAERFCERFAPLVDFPLLPLDDANEVASRSDVIVTSTTSHIPLFDGRSVQSGTHINAVGAFTPTTRELDGACVAQARVFADTRAGARAEAGDLLLAEQEGAIGPDHLRAELGDVLLGNAIGRDSADAITLFESVGAAFQDAVTATLAYRRALERGIGGRFAFS